MTFDEALQAERDGHLVRAANHYERLLEKGTPPLRALLNLAVLYWQTTDYGYWTTKGLPQDFVAKAGQRFPEVLARAGDLYPESTEVKFWTKYIEWADLGEPLSVEDCVRWLQEDEEALVPVMFLFSQSGGQEYGTEATALLAESKKHDTTLSRYVASVIESVRARR